MARSLPVENLLPQKVGQLSTTCSNALKQPTGELLVAVNHNQLRTMASESIDPINWSHPPPSWAVPPERLVHSINQCTSAESNVQPQLARQPPCLCGHSGYVAMWLFLPGSCFLLDHPPVLWWLITWREVGCHIMWWLV